MWYPAFSRRTAATCVVRFPDFPELHVAAASEAEAAEQAVQVLGARILDVLESGALPPRPGAPRAREDETRMSVPLRPAVAVIVQLRWMRHRQGLSQEQVAQRMGVTRQRVAHIESCAENWTLQTLERLTQALGGELHVTMRKRKGTGRQRAAS